MKKRETLWEKELRNLFRDGKIEELLMSVERLKNEAYFVGREDLKQEIIADFDKK